MVESKDTALFVCQQNFAHRNTYREVNRLSKYKVLEFIDLIYRLLIMFFLQFFDLLVTSDGEKMAVITHKSEQNGHLSHNNIVPCLFIGHKFLANV